MLEITLAVTVFVVMIMALALVILAARARLVATGDVRITVNDRRELTVPVGGTLLSGLADAGVHLPSGCGGKGTCGQCRVRVLAGADPISPVEATRIGRAEAAAGERLACQVTVRRPMKIGVADEVLGARRFTCVARSSRNVTALIREIVLEVPEGEAFEFDAGAYVQVVCPPYRLAYGDMKVDAAYHATWDRLGLWRLEAGTAKPATRAYSLANAPSERGIIMLLVRLAIPPPDAPPTTPPGVVSSYLFGVEPGDRVTVAGPYGHFFAQPGDREMVFIGGGAGMAPMRSHIVEQLRYLGTRRTISFWYGARRVEDVFYREEFDRLEREFDNFRWTVALSEPGPDETWTGPTGFIHQVVHDLYLAKHPAPEECEYYLCGPPVMSRAVMRMLDGLGVEPESIFYDDFGS